MDFETLKTGEETTKSQSRRQSAHAIRAERLATLQEYQGRLSRRMEVHLGLHPPTGDEVDQTLHRLKIKLSRVARDIKKLEKGAKHRNGMEGGDIS